MDPWIQLQSGSSNSSNPEKNQTMTEPTGHQEGSQPPLLMLEVMDPYAAWKPLITSAAGADTSAISPSLTLALTVGMFVGFLGLQLTRFGQSHRKNGVSALIRACVQLISGMASFWLVGFALANSRSENPFLAFHYNKMYIHDATLLGGTALIDKFLIQLFMTLLVTGSVCATGHESNLMWADAMVSAVMAGPGLPLPTYWCWSVNGWLQTRGFNDFGGAGVIMAVGFGGCLCMTLFAKDSNVPRVSDQSNNRYSDTRDYTN